MDLITLGYILLGLAVLVVVAAMIGRLSLIMNVTSNIVTLVKTHPVLAIVVIILSIVFVYLGGSVENVVL